MLLFHDLPLERQIQQETTSKIDSNTEMGKIKKVLQADTDESAKHWYFITFAIDGPEVVGVGPTTGVCLPEAVLDGGKGGGINPCCAGVRGRELGFDIGRDGFDVGTLGAIVGVCEPVAGLDEGTGGTGGPVRPVTETDGVSGLEIGLEVGRGGTTGGHVASAVDCARASSASFLRWRAAANFWPLPAIFLYCRYFSNEE